MGKKICFIFLILILIVAQGVFALTAESGTYSVHMFGSGSQSSSILSDNYKGVMLLTTNIGGNAQGSLYSAIIGFFEKLFGITPIVYSVTINQTETVQAGNVYSVTIEVINSSGNADVTSIPKITLYDSLKNLIISDADATLLSGKKYEYNFTTSLNHTAGEWQTNITIGINSATKRYSSSWNLSNGHTAISIDSVNTASSPTISANVTITNEDALEYNYSYKYCIVSVYTQQCGDSENVAYGSGYKLLAANESWNPILSLNINQSGNYLFKVSADYETQSSGASRRFSASYTPEEEEETGGTTGGPGGGGTPSANQLNIIEIQESASASEQQVVKGVTAQFETNEKLIINFKPSGSTIIESHTVTMSSVGTNNVTIVISSVPITLELNIGEEKEVDVDGDWKNDIYFKLKNITNGKADLFIRQVTSQHPSITGELIKRPAQLMDLTTRILDDYKIINPGNKVLMEVAVFNYGTEAIKDVKMRYCIETSNRSIISCTEETIAVYTKFQLVKEFLISSNTIPGEYFIKTEAVYSDETVSSETNFEVKEQEYFIGKNLLVPVILGTFILTLLITIIFLVYKRGRKRRELGYIREYKPQVSYKPQVIRRYERNEGYNKIAIENLKNKLNLWKRKGYAGTERLKDELKHLRENKTFIFIIFAGILLITLMLNRKMTGMAIANSLGAVKGGIFLLPLVFVLIVIFAIIKRKKVKELAIDLLNSIFRKNEPSNYLSGVIGMKVYCSEGNYIGKVEEIYIDKKSPKIYGFLIKLNKGISKKIKKKGILIRYKNIKATKHIILIDKLASKYLED